MINIAKPMIGDEEKHAVLEVLDSGILAQGPRVKAFEAAFAEMCEVKHAIATSSGTTALHTALLAHGLGPGDEVITSSFTFIASANSIHYTGARPVFVDINPRTFNIDPGLIEPAITRSTKAIMPIHLFGLCCEMDPIVELAQKHGLVILEDACQAHGAAYQDKKAGSFGTGVFSLYPTKNITSAEGGMITTNDPDVAEKSRTIRQHGMRRRYYHDELGFNYRMTDVHAAIGLAQLKKLDHYNLKRLENARFLSQNLEGVITPYVPDGCQHVFHQYTVRVPNGRRDALLEHLNACEIMTSIYYPVPVHKQTFYMQELGYSLSLPVAEMVAQEVLSLPVHPGLSRADLERIVSAVNNFFVRK